MLEDVDPEGRGRMRDSCHCDAAKIWSCEGNKQFFKTSFIGVDSSHCFLGFFFESQSGYKGKIVGL